MIHSVVPPLAFSGKREGAAMDDGRVKISGCLITKRRMTHWHRSHYIPRMMRDISWNHKSYSSLYHQPYELGAIFAGIFAPDENDLAATVCPRHCDPSGTRWRCVKGSHGRGLCSIPTALAVHKSPSTTGACGLNFALSKFVEETHKILLPVGSGMYLRQQTPSFSEIIIMIEITLFILDRPIS